MDYLYVDDDTVEKDNGIQFEEGGPHIQRRLDKLESDLDKMQARLGGDTMPNIIVPPKGFLVKGLMEQQKIELNRVLAEKYARRNVSQQRKLLEEMKVVDCGDEMVSLQAVLHQRKATASFSQRPFEESCGSYAGKSRIWWLRNEVAFKLANVIYALNAQQIKPLIEDCYRPPEVQRGLFIRRLVEVSRAHPTRDHDTIKTIASSFTASIPGLAGHQAGAAVDLRFGTYSDKLNDIGNNYPEGSIVACLNCPYVTVEQFCNRQFFAQTMRWGGFKVLDTENWHASHGDRGLSIEGQIINKTAVYGPIYSFSASADNDDALDLYRRDELDIPHLSDNEVYQVIDLARRQLSSPAIVRMLVKPKK